MNILFISPYLPSETSGHAGAQLIFRNIVSLANSHNVTLASFIDTDEYGMISALVNHEIKVNTISYPRNQTSLPGKISSGIRNLTSMLQYIQREEPFFFAKYKKKKMAELISRLVAEYNFDLVQFEYNVMHHYAEQIGKIPKVIVFHDVSAKLYERGWASGRASDKRSYEIAKELEPEIANKFDAVITLTKDDNAYLADLGCTTDLLVIPPQIRIPDIGDIPKSPNSICFVGSYNRAPNVQAVQILTDEIYPKLSGTVSLNIVGKDLPDQIIRQINDMEGVNYLGFIDDIDSFIASQMLMVAPIQIGAGLKMKIPHALACGTAVITTAVGAEGIDIGAQNGLWVTNSNEEMAKKVNEFLPQKNLLIDIGKSGKKAVGELFSEGEIVNKFESLYSSLVNS